MNKYFLSFCSVAIQTYAVMGVNTALIQAAVMTKAKVYTAVPAQMKARIDIVKGNFKVEFLSLQGINTIASAQYVHALSLIAMHFKDFWSFSASVFIGWGFFSHTALRRLPLREMWKTSQSQEAHH